jgi:hypothetical protein
MKQFDKLLQEEIDQFQSGHVASITNIARDMHEAESQLQALRDKLHHAVEQLNAMLAVEIRKRMPMLAIRLASGKCHVSYKSKSITVKPDVYRNRWDIDPNDMGRGFMRAHADVLPLQEDLGPIAVSVIEYFTSQYRTLQKVSGNHIPRPKPPKPNPEPIKPIGEGRPIRRRGKSKPGNTYYA